MYSVKPKNKTWKEFSTCVVGISPANKNWSIEKSLALADFARTNFDQVILCVSDTLYRHTLAEEQNVSLHEAYKAARSLGDEWFDKYGKPFWANPNCVLYRWDEWKAYDEFDNFSQLAQRAYEEDAGFKAAVDWDSAKFQQRKGIPSIEACRAFLLEEVAGLATLYDHFDACELYAGHQLHCLSYIRQNKLPLLKGSGLSKSGFTPLYLLDETDIQNLAA